VNQPGIEWRNETDAMAITAATANAIARRTSTRPSELIWAKTSISDWGSPAVVVDQVEDGPGARGHRSDSEKTRSKQAQPVDGATGEAPLPAGCQDAPREVGDEDHESERGQDPQVDGDEIGPAVPGVCGPVLPLPRRRLVMR
jgi:hypothetical protein